MGILLLYNTNLMTGSEAVLSSFKLWLKSQENNLGLRQSHQVFVPSGFPSVWLCLQSKLSILTFFWVLTWKSLWIHLQAWEIEPSPPVSCLKLSVWTHLLCFVIAVVAQGTCMQQCRETHQITCGHVNLRRKLNNILSHFFSLTTRKSACIYKVKTYILSHITARERPLLLWLPWKVNKPAKQ